MATAKKGMGRNRSKSPFNTLLSSTQANPVTKARTQVNIKPTPSIVNKDQWLSHSIIAKRAIKTEPPPYTQAL
jgi:hypothetical protein